MAPYSFQAVWMDFSLSSPLGTITKDGDKPQVEICTVQEEKKLATRPRKDIAVHSLLRLLGSPPSFLILDHHPPLTNNTEPLICDGGWRAGGEGCQQAGAEAVRNFKELPPPPPPIQSIMLEDYDGSG